MLSGNDPSFPDPQEDADGVIPIPGIADHVRIAGPDAPRLPAGDSTCSSHLSWSRRRPARS